MNQIFQQLDLQSLIDLLAKETENYTKAFSNGTVKDAASHQETMDALITEIKSRKQADLQETRLEPTPEKIPDRIASVSSGT